MRVKYLPQDYAARCNGGICFVDGHPFVLYITGDNVHGEIRRLTSTKKTGTLIELKSERLDISSPLLGYVNYNKSTFYIMRSPDRKYKQVVEASSLVASECGTTKSFVGDIGAIIYSKQGEDMLLGNYPTLKEASALVRSGTVTSIAIHRFIALGLDSFGAIRVYYKNKEVGRIKVKGSNVVSVPKGELAWVVSKYLEGYDWVVE